MIIDKLVRTDVQVTDVFQVKMQRHQVHGTSTFITKFNSKSKRNKKLFSEAIGLPYKSNILENFFSSMYTV